MNNNTYFDEEDENIFSDEDISYDTPSKAPLPVKGRHMAEFLAWLDRFHPELQVVSTLSLHKLSQLIGEYELAIGRSSGYTPQEWQYSLRKQG